MEGERLYNCPECPEIFRTPEELGPHIERHFPIYDPSTRPLTLVCPGGCGRLLPRDFGEIRTDERLSVKGHIKLCDGSPPILPSIHDEAEVRGGVIPLESHPARRQSREKTAGYGRAGTPARGNDTGRPWSSRPDERSDGEGRRKAALPSPTGWVSARTLKLHLVRG